MKISKILSRMEIMPTFWLFLCAYYYFDPAGTFTAFLASVFLHESGHLLALKLCKVPIHKLRLSATGAELQTPPLSYRQTLIVAAAGPTVNFLLLVLLLHRVPEAALLNFGLLFYNLLPFYPLDGGQLLWALLHLILNDRAACVTQWMTCLVCGVGLLVGSCLLTCVWHAGLWPVLLCAILLTRVTFPTFSASHTGKPPGQSVKKRILLFRGEEKCERKPSGCPFTFHNPPAGDKIAKHNSRNSILQF